jgi:hypothetical protein
VNIDDAVENMPLPVMVGDLTPTWSPRGLVAISANQAATIDGDRSPTRSWTVVVDPTTGERLADIPGWHALAWSPDGTGLMAARRTGADTTGLRLFWGPALQDHTDLGELDLPFTPWWWVTGTPGF